MNCTKKLQALLVAAALLSVTSVSHAAYFVAFQDNMEGYNVGTAFSPTNIPPIGDHWESHGDDALGNIDIVAGKALEVSKQPGGFVIAKGFLTAADAANTTNQIFSLSFDVKVPSGLTTTNGGPGLEVLNGNTVLFDLRFLADGSVGFVPFTTQVVTDTTLDHNLDGWNHVHVVANIATELFNLTVNGNTINNLEFTTTGASNNVFDNVDVFTTGNNIVSGQFDNFLVVVPEPSGFALSAIVGGMILRRRRCQRTASRV